MAHLELVSGTTPRELPTEAAFRAILPEMKALGEAELLSVNVDVLHAVTTVLGALPELRALRPEIAKHLVSFNLERFDKIEQYTQALNHAHALHRGALGSRTSLADLGGEVAELRDRLLNDAQSLASHRLLNGERLQECKRSPAYRAIASDVLTLVALFKEHWPKIENRTPVSADLLQQAGGRALDLLAAIGEKDQAPLTVSDAQLTRQQAFTLFHRAYEDARRAVQYLRYDEGDAASLAPTFYTGRPSRGAAPAEADNGGAPSAVEAGQKTAAGKEEEVAAPIVFSNPHNLPITSPFVS